MSHTSTGGRGLVATASILGLLVVATACGTKSGDGTDVVDVAADTSGLVTHAGQATRPRSQRALDADARRWARGNVTPTAAPARVIPGPRVPDARP